MKFHEVLLAAADTHRIDTDIGAATHWIARQIGLSNVKMAIDFSGDDPAIVVSRDWLKKEKRWEKWQRNFRILKRLVSLKENPPKPGTKADTFTDEMAIVDEYISRMRPVFCGDAVSHNRKADGEFQPKHCWPKSFSTCGEVELFLTNEEGGQICWRYLFEKLPDDLQSLWQLAFAGLLDFPGFVSPSFCADCKRSFTTRSGQPAKADVCPSCNTKRWRRKNRKKAKTNDDLHNATKKDERERKARRKKRSS